MNNVLRSALDAGGVISAFLNLHVCDRTSSRASETGAAVRVVQLETFDDYTCALTSKGKVYCWGRLGQACQDPSCRVTWNERGPQEIHNLPPIRQIALGAYVALAVAKDSGEVFAWGQVGPVYRDDEPEDPALDVVESDAVEIRSTDRNEPVQIHTGMSVVTIGGKGRFPQQRTTKIPVSTRIRTDGTIFMGSGQLCVVEPGDRVSCAVPSLGMCTAGVTLVPSYTRREEQSLPGFLGADCNTCVAFRSGLLRCAVPDGRGGHTAVKEDMLPPLVAVDFDGYWAAVTQDGDVLISDFDDPWIRHHPDSPAIAIDYAGTVICYVTKKGEAWCGVPESTETGRRLAFLKRIEGIEATDVAQGGRHTCVLSKQGQVFCLGSNVSNVTGLERGPDEVTTPTLVRIPGTF